MKIVFIGPFGLQPKGTMSVRALPLAKALVERGHAVTVLIPPWDDPNRAGQTWNDGGVQVINVPLPPAVPLLFHSLLTRTLVAYTLRQQPDVIHLFKPKAYAGLAHLVLWWLRRLGGHSARLVLDADDWEQAWNQVLPYSPLQKRLFAWQETWGIRQADAVTAASRTVQRLAEQHRSGATGVHYVPNGYQPDPLSSTAVVDPAARQLVRDQWKLAQSPTILLYSRFAEFRLARIVTLVRAVANRMPAALWLIVGQGLYGEEQQAARLLAQAGLSDYVRFTGWPVDNLAAHFAAADVAVHPYDDTLINRAKCSVKLIELMRAGLPVVADAVGQNKAYIQADVSGLLTPAEDDAAFSRAVVGLLQSSERRGRLGQAAVRRIEENFSWPQLSKKVENAYH